MSRYVYLLWDHEESGPETIVATLDREKLVNLLTSNFNPDTKHFQYETFFDWLRAERNVCPIEKLVAALEQPDEELAKYSIGLVGGWGGAHLQVLELK